jgi:hypothetical protein
MFSLNSSAVWHYQSNALFARSAQTERIQGSCVSIAVCLSHVFTTVTAEQILKTLIISGLCEEL